MSIPLGGVWFYKRGGEERRGEEKKGEEWRDDERKRVKKINCYCLVSH